MYRFISTTLDRMSEPRFALDGMHSESRAIYEGSRTMEKTRFALDEQMQQNVQLLLMKKMAAAAISA